MSDIRGVVHGGSGVARAGRDAFRSVAVTPNGVLFAADYLHALAREGRIFVARDADEDDTITGATSYAATTPTFLLAVPDNTIAIPLWVGLVQAGTVAGGNISVHISADNTNLYSSGGTAETGVKSTRTDNPTSPLSTLYSTAGSAITAAAATTSRIVLHHARIAPDVDPASADAQNFDFLWDGSKFPIYVVGAGSFLVYTYAATTGPTWRWSIGWAEVPESELN